MTAPVTAPVTAQNTRAGIWLMIATTLVFAAQDGISRHLASEYSVMMVVMIRFWVFGLFVLALAALSSRGLREAARFRWETTAQHTLVSYRNALNRLA